MSDYAIGDLQGCYEPLQRLLEHIQFNEKTDRLWFAGDLVNRGPDSLAVLRFISSLPLAPIVTLGNHDLHLLSILFGTRSWKDHDETLEELIQADDAETLGHWLRKQPIIHYDPEYQILMSHAGIAPFWDLSLALSLAKEVEHKLSGDDCSELLSNMYGNKPDNWSEQWTGIDRLRVIINYCTRMRFCDNQGTLQLTYKGTIEQAPPGLYPWFAVPHRQELDVDIIFGHWAALMGRCPHPKIHAIDTGCFWGGPLTALRLQDRQRFSVPGLKR